MSHQYLYNDASRFPFDCEVTRYFMASLQCPMTNKQAIKSSKTKLHVWGRHKLVIDVCFQLWNFVVYLTRI
jgi:hypothetical protein